MEGPLDVVETGLEQEDRRVSPAGDLSETDPMELAVQAAPGGVALGPRTPALHPLHGTNLDAVGAAPTSESPEQPTATRPAGLAGDLRDAGPVALASFGANGAQIVVTLLLARLLTTRGYGAMAQLTALFLIVSMPGTALAVGVVRRVTALSASAAAGSVGAWARRVHVRAVGLVVAFSIVVFAARAPLSRLLSIPAPLGVFAILAAGGVWVLLSLDRGLLQSHREYRTLSANLLVEGGVRTAAVLVLVAAGLGVAGVAWGVLVAEVVTALHARWGAQGTWGNGRAVAGPLEEAPAAVASRHRLLADVGAALVAMALLAYLQNVDVIILGREAPHASGPYAAISVASKALVFGAIALGGYLLPEAAIEWHQGGHALRQLAVTSLVLALPATVLLLAAVVFPRQLLSFVFSNRYLADRSAFWLLALAMVLLSATVVMTLYLLAAGRRWIGALLLAGAVAATVAISSGHGSPHVTARTDFLVQGAIALAVGVSLAIVHSRRRRSGFVAGSIS